MADDLDEAALADMFRLTKKKKKKAPKAEEPVPGMPPTEEPDLDEESYEDMLSKIYLKMGEKEQVAGLKLKPPKVQRIGSKKTAWINFRDSCGVLNRGEEHLSLFLSSELGILVSTTQEGALLMRGIFPSNKLEGCLKKYVELYVKCPMCRSLQTNLKKDSDTRLFMLHCDNCRATRTVETIKAGFIPTTKADRKKSKADD